MFNILKSLGSSSRGVDDVPRTTAKNSKRRTTVHSTGGINRARSVSTTNTASERAQSLIRQYSLNSDSIEMDEPVTGCVVSAAELSMAKKLTKVAAKLNKVQEKTQSPNSSKESLAQRLFIFRTLAEEKEIYHKTQHLMDEAIDLVADAWLNLQFSLVVEQLIPEHRGQLKDRDERKMVRLSSRLSMALVANPEELLANRNESFQSERGPSTETTDSAEHALDAAPARMKINLPVYSNGQGVVCRVMGMKGAKLNPLLSPTGRQYAYKNPIPKVEATTLE